MATAVEKKTLGVAPRGLGLGWAIGSLAILALTGVVVAAVLFLAQPPTTPSVDAGRIVPIYTPDERAVLRLVTSGVLPHEVLDREPFRTKQLVAEGVLPRETLEPGPAIYSAGERRALVAAIAAGVIPKEVLDPAPFRTTSAHGSETDPSTP